MQSIRAFELALEQNRADVALIADKIEGTSRRLEKLRREFEERCNEQAVYLQGLKTAMTTEIDMAREEIGAVSDQLRGKVNEPNPGAPPMIEGVAEERHQGNVKMMGGRK